MTSPKDPKHEHIYDNNEWYGHESATWQECHICHFKRYPTPPISSSRLGDEGTVKESLTVGDNHIGDANEKVLITPNSRELDAATNPSLDSEGELELKLKIASILGYRHKTYEYGTFFEENQPNDFGDSWYDVTHKVEELEALFEQHRTKQ